MSDPDNEPMDAADIHIKKLQAEIERLRAELKIWKPDTSSLEHSCPGCGRGYNLETDQRQDMFPCGFKDSHRWEVVGTTATCIDCGTPQAKREGGVIGPQWTHEHHIPTSEERRTYLEAGTSLASNGCSCDTCVELFGRPDYDPTPWCHVCSAMEQSACTCLPIASNH